MNQCMHKHLRICDLLIFIMEQNFYLQNGRKKYISIKKIQNSQLFKEMTK